MRRQSGFSLLEMIVVVTLLALAYALVAPRLGAGGDAIALKSAARQLAAGLRQARSTAVASGSEASLVLDLKTGQFVITGDVRQHRLPEGLQYGLFTASSEQIDGDRGGVRFFADGSSTGGRIAVAAGGTRQFVDIDWLTGRVRVLEP